MKEYKIALMGAGGVGKTSMIKQFVENSFDEMSVCITFFCTRVNKYFKSCFVRLLTNYFTLN